MEAEHGWPSQQSTWWRLYGDTGEEPGRLLFRCEPTHDVQGHLLQSPLDHQMKYVTVCNSMYVGSLSRTSTMMIYDRLFLLDAVEHYKDRTETATKPLAAFLLGEKKYVDNVLH
jgi:hypothetical protein